ncbi:heterokaryon incompatibility protein-domain-containing protein [Chaetomium sp. MPI-CAGE-AT-0009]|nr:heterokaryon incompatibility protein-domain-containing protein [Chaetomium sp. MPI-CAGE-AT-0009]
MKTASWLHNCQENHSCKIIPGAMPTRLIQVTGTLETGVMLRLCEMAKEVRVPYAALSYCWGGEQPMKCLSSNINSYPTSIPFDGQPETIKDAARVCLGAGIQYLWIDALCIIQDDPDDKPNEIAQMPSIYGGATVTIVAAGSASATQGFLGERTPSCFEAAVVPYRCLDGELGSITLVKLGGLLESVVEPIDQRGWTLQERLLSSRIIEFGSWQTRWICSETKLDGFSLEGFTDGWKRDVPYGSTRQSEALDLDMIRTTKSTVDFYGRPRASQFQEHTKAMKHWENICVSFTERTLTLSADRALAISGIAQIFAQYSGDQCLAGLWKSYFHSGLLWKIQHSSTKPKSIPRPIAYQGPSWSWLSVNGSVFFDNARRPSACVAEILSCEVEPANKSAPYGLIREDSGQLVLAAHTSPAMRYQVKLRSPGRFKDELMIIGTRPRVACYATAEMCLDVQGEEPDEIEEKAGCLSVEICREHHGDDISC